MRPHTLLVLTGPVLLGLTGCTSDLPAPYCDELPDRACGAMEPSRPANELAVECGTLPLTANSATYDQTPADDPELMADYQVLGRFPEATYQFSLEGDAVPAGLTIDESTGALSGVIEADPGTYTFEIVVQDAEDPEAYNARGTCSLEVNPRLDTSLAMVGVPDCLRGDQSLLDIVVSATGDESPITCDIPGGNGNGREPTGIGIDPNTCRLNGVIDESRPGTWVFMVRGSQSGRDVLVPYCVTNENPDPGLFEVRGSHSDSPFVETYDQDAEFRVGGGDDPRYEMVVPGACSCKFGYNYDRTLAPIDEIPGDSPCPEDNRDPGLCFQPGGGTSEGFFHGVFFTGPPVPEVFHDRPWIVSISADYCYSFSQMNCDAKDIDQIGGGFEFGIIMVPE